MREERGKGREVKVGVGKVKNGRQIGSLGRIGERYYKERDGTKEKRKERENGR